MEEEVGWEEHYLEYLICIIYIFNRMFAAAYSTLSLESINDDVATLLSFFQVDNSTRSE